MWSKSCNMFPDIVDATNKLNNSNKPTKKPVDTLKICILAMFTALYVVLAFVSIPLGNSLKISIEGFPIFIMALFYGWKEGLTVGVLGPFIYQMLNFGFTPTTVLWILPHAMTGYFTGLIKSDYDKWKLYEANPKREYHVKDEMYNLMIFIFLVCCFSTLLNSLAIYVDSKMYGYYNPVLITGMLAPKFAMNFAKGMFYARFIPEITHALDKFLKK